MGQRWSSTGVNIEILYLGWAAAPGIHRKKRITINRMSSKDQSLWPMNHTLHTLWDAAPQLGQISCTVLCFCNAFVSHILTIPWAAMSAAKVLLPEVPGVQRDRRTSCPPTWVRSISIRTASACSALSYSATPKPRNGLPSSWASWKTETKKQETG